MKIIGKSWLTLLACLVPAVVLSQGLKEAGGKLGAMSGQGVALSGNFGGVTGTVVAMALSLVGTIFFVLMIYGGFVWIKSAGREDEITRAKKIVITAIVGLAVVLSSYAITNFVLNRLAGQPATGGNSNSCADLKGNCAGVTACTSDVGVAVEGTDCPENKVCCTPK